MLELAGGLTVGLALSIATVVEVRVWWAIQSGGKDGEHADYKIRIEARRLKAKREEVVEQVAILQKLEELHKLMEKEKADVKAMHDDQQRAEKREDSNDADQDGVEEHPLGNLSYANPLQADNGEESEEEA